LKGEIPVPASSQFHQYFTSSFCADILFPKNQSQTDIIEKQCKALLIEKGAHKKC